MSCFIKVSRLLSTAIFTLPLIRIFLPMIKKPILIGISGPSCSGKTCLADHLIDLLPGRGNSILSIDSYYRDLTKVDEVERLNWNFDSPSSLDRALLEYHVRELVEGRAIIRPVYLFPSHTRAPEGVRVTPGDHVIVEGLFAFYWAEIRKSMGVRVFIEADDSVCRSRRFERDIRERGCTMSELVRQYEEEVLPCYTRLIQPTRQYAHLILDGSDPPVQLAQSVMDYINSMR